MNALRLGVNIDHIATLRQARGTTYPDPLEAMQLAVQAGADGITIHLREDRRHIQDSDVYRLKEVTQVPLNLEIAVTPDMLDIACEVKPAFVCLVPEKREEITTEGGLDCLGLGQQVTAAVAQLQRQNITVSLFVDPDPQQIQAAYKAGAQIVEIHTGDYAEAKTELAQADALFRVQQAAALATRLGLVVNAGHGLNYDNVQPIAALPELHELNIGHSIIARAAFVGLVPAVQAMKALMNAVR